MPNILGVYDVKGTCSATNYSVLITNTTSATQTVMGKKGVLESIAAGKTGWICWKGTTKTLLSIYTLKADSSAQIDVLTFIHVASNILGGGSSLTWSPNSLVVREITGTCSTTNYSIGIVNTTTQYQTLVNHGISFLEVAPEDYGLVCVVVTGTSTVSLVADPGAHLKVKSIA